MDNLELNAEALDAAMRLGVEKEYLSFLENIRNAREILDRLGGRVKLDQ